MYRSAESSVPRRGSFAAWNIVWAGVPWIAMATGLAMRALVSSRRGPGFAANSFAEWYGVHSVLGGGAVLAVAALFLGALLPVTESTPARIARWISAAMAMVAIGVAAFVATQSTLVPDAQGVRLAMSLADCTIGSLLAVLSGTSLRRTQTPERWTSVLVSGLVLIVAGVAALRDRDARWVHASVTVLTVAMLVANADVDRVRRWRGAWVAALLALFAVSRAITFPNALALRLIVVLTLYFAWVCRPRTASLGASLMGGFALICLAESFGLRHLADAAENDIAFADTLFTDAVSHLEAFMLLLALAALLARDVSLTGARRVTGGLIAVLLGVAVQLFCAAFAVLGIRGMPRRYYTYPPELDALHRNATIAGIALTLLAIAWVAVFLRPRARSE